MTRLSGAVLRSVLRPFVLSSVLSSSSLVLRSASVETPRAPPYAANVRVIVAGGTGFLGQALIQRLRGAGHTVSVLTRRATPGAADQIAWQPDGTAGEWKRALDRADAIVNLAGEGIADARWSEARKQALRTSRILPTRSLVSAMRTSLTARRSSSALRALATTVTAAPKWSPNTPPQAPTSSPGCVSSGKPRREQASDLARVAIAAQRARAPSKRRRTRPHAAAVPDRRRRPSRIRHPVPAVDSPRRLDAIWSNGSSRRRPRTVRST